ncbi:MULTISPECIES: catecholate siderophore receptor Fiu [Undibacterium]|nr:MULTISPECIES: catecholate siderophore receptor Fiu [Undibacterium]
MIKSRQHAHISSPSEQASSSHGALPQKHVSMTAVIASLILPMTAQAAGQATATASDQQKISPAKQEQQLKEVLVVGQNSNEFKSEKASSSKYAAPLLDTPQTITVIKRELIEQQAAVNLSESLRNTPGVGTFFLGENGSTNTGDAIYMRGFDSSSSIYVDGVRDLGSISRDLFNIEQIDVLKASAGTDSGRSAPTGSINLSSKQATLDEAQLYNASIGSAQQKRLSSDTNFVLNRENGSALRLNLMAQDSGVAGREQVKNQRWAIAPSLAFGLNSNTQFFLNYLHVQQDNVPDGGVPTLGLPGYSSPDSKRPFLSTASKVSSSLFYGSVNDFDRVQADMLTVRLEHQLSERSKLSNIARIGKTSQHYLLTAFMGNATNLQTPSATDPSTWTIARSTRTLKDQENEILANQTQLTVDTQLFGLRHQMLGGIELIHEKQNTWGYSGTGTLPAAKLYAPNPYDAVSGLNLVRNGVFTRGSTSTASTYVFDRIELNSVWAIDAGLRLDHYNTDYSAASLSTATSNPSLPAGTLVPVNLNNSGNLLNAKLGVVYKPSATSSLYASASSSKQPPGGSNFALSTAANSAANPKFDPQDTVNVELGAKWDLLDKKLSLSSAIYSTKISNDIVQNPLDLLYYQTGKKEVNGLELSATGALTRDWLVSAGYALMDTKVSSGPVVTASGMNNLSYTPKHSFTAWTSYSLSNGIKVGGGLRYVDSLLRGTDGAIGTPAKTEAYTVLDMMASYPISRHIEIQLNVYNLANANYVAAINKSGYRYTPGAPRSGTVTLNLKF